MKIILLAAGEGSRLQPYTADTPKCMVEIEGKSLLDCQLDTLNEAGVDDQIIIGGYLSDRLGSRGKKILLNPRYDETNMVWTLFCAEDELDGEVIISYGDIVYSKQILKSLLKSEADISVIIDLEWESYWKARMENPLDDAETLKLDSDGTIKEIGKKPRSMEEIEGQYIGLMKFSEKGISVMKKVFHDAKKTGKMQGKNIENVYMTELLQEIIDRGYKVTPVPVHGGWIEVDTVEDLESEVTKSRLSEIMKN